MREKRKNPIGYAERRRDRERLKRYGVTVPQYMQLMAEQDGRCALCSLEWDRDLFVDHDHVTKQVRGLLCGPCNLILGHARDQAYILRAGIDYLRRAKQKQFEVVKEKGA